MFLTEKMVGKGVRHMEKDMLSTAVSEPVILRNGLQPSIKGPDAWFTGTVRIDPLFPAHRRHVPQSLTSLSSRAPVRHGIPILWGRL